MHSLRSNWPGARHEGRSVSAGYSTDRATKPQANFSATLRAAVLFRSEVVARSLQTHQGYARRSRLVRAKNPWPRMPSLFLDGPLAKAA